VYSAAISFDRVAVHPDRIEINISRRRLAELLSGQLIDLTIRDQRLDRKLDDLVTLTVSARLKRVGREMRMLDGPRLGREAIRIIFSPSLFWTVDDSFIAAAILMRATDRQPHPLAAVKTAVTDDETSPVLIGRR